MFITTAGRTNEEMIEKAKALSLILGIPYVYRNKRSVQLLQEEMDSACLVVGKQRLELYQKGFDDPFFFHPNSAMFRIKRLLNGENDPFVETAQLSQGMSVLDCTLGLSSDAIVASFMVGSQGQVTGLEAQKYLSFIVQEGLITWESGLEKMNQAMRQIHVIHTSAVDYLKTLPNESYDCVYFDPMFEEKILESDGIKALGKIASYEGLSDEGMEQALRVAKKRVILKDHFRSKNFEQYGFTVDRRRTAKFHFGFIEK